jgi:hypothetical protein
MMAAAPRPRACQPTTTRILIMCDAMLFFVLPILVMPAIVVFGATGTNARLHDEGVARQPALASHPQHSFPSAADAAVQTLVLGLRAVFCTAIYPLLTPAGAHAVFLASSVAHHALVVFVLTGFHALGRHHLGHPAGAPPLDAQIRNAFVFAGVIYVASVLFGIRTIRRWSRGSRSPSLRSDFRQTAGAQVTPQVELERRRTG